MMKTNHLHRTGIGIGAALAVALCVPAAARATECLDCHDDVPKQEAFKASAHAKLGADGSTGCVDCHGTFPTTDEGHEKPAKVDCNKCHQAVGAVLVTSVHGPANDSGPSCTDCHGTHDVAKKAESRDRNQRIAKHCGTCHEKELKEYEGSWHGRSPSAKVATCTDCHGDHAILPPLDPKSTVFRLNQAQSCAKCHTDESRGFEPGMVEAVKDYFGSVHGIAATKGGLLVSATCVDCHGDHDVTHGREGGGNRISRSKIPDTCGKCHAGVVKTYFESVHGKPFLEGNLDVPVCTDCHRSHQIRSHFEQAASTYTTHVAETCLKCHAQGNVVNKYGITEAKVQTYQESFHGASSKLGDTRVANCSSCHEFHDIRKSTDPLASTNKANMTRTCGKCHKVEDITKPITEGKIHTSLAEDRHWLSALIEKAYVVLITMTMGFFVSYMLADIWRTRRKRGNGGGHH